MSWTLREVPDEVEARWLADGSWDDRTLGQLLAAGLQEHPDLVCRVHSDDRPWAGTFADLRREALLVAGGLRARGIGPGDPVAFQLPNWHEAVITFYAASFLGAVVVPIVHTYGPKEVGYILERTGVRAFVTGTTFGSIDFRATLELLPRELEAVEVVAVVGLAAPQDGWIPFAELLTGDTLEKPAAVDPRSPALVAYTSGTTADPKGVIHSHRTIGAEIRQLGATQPPGAPPQLVGLPVGHAIGMLSALLLPVERGRPINLVDRWNPDDILRLMLEHGLACGSGATFFLTSLLDHPGLTPEHLELMRFVGLGGAPVPAAVAERAGRAGISIVRMYGSTEHPSITGATHDEPEVKRWHTDGRALPGVDVRLVDGDGKDVPAGVPGEILSRGPDCCVGYSDPALTAAAFDRDGWFRTEDVGVLDGDGYLRIADRLKDVIIRGGENISAVEVEEVLAAIPGVAEVAVVAAPHQRYGEQVCAVIRPSGAADPPDLDALRQATEAAGLARPKWPEMVLLVDDLPRTPSGKVRKAALRERLRAPAGGSEPTGAASGAASVATTMASAVYQRPGVVAIEERPIPEPGPGQVLVEVGHCGICGSDIHMILEGWGRPGVVEGHEWTGVIAAVGADVEGWQLGDAVVGGPSPRCGSCRRCREGKPSQCENRARSMAEDIALDGAFADYILVDQRSLLSVPEGLSPRSAALAEPLAVALHSLTRAELVEGDSVMVFGAGPIGALAIAVLVARGFGPIAVVEPAPKRQELALALGADEVLHPSELETFPIWEPDRIADEAVHVVLECSGKKDAMEAGLCQLSRGGRMVLVGAGIEPPTFDPNRMLLNELSVCGSFVYDDAGFEAALDLLSSPGFPLDLLIAPDDVPLDGLVDAMQDLARGRIAAKAMVVPRYRVHSADAAVGARR